MVYKVKEQKSSGKPWGDAVLTSADTFPVSFLGTASVYECACGVCVWCVRVVCACVRAHVCSPMSNPQGEEQET